MKTATAYPVVKYHYCHFIIFFMFHSKYYGMTVQNDTRNYKTFYHMHYFEQLQHKLHEALLFAPTLKGFNFCFTSAWPVRRK